MTDDGCVRIAHRVLATRLWMSPSRKRRMVALNVPTVRSAKPLLEGCHGRVWRSLTPFFAKKSLVLAETKERPLSVTIYRGRPKSANM